MLSPFELERPVSIPDAVSRIGEDALPYCGGTELLLAMKMGLLRPGTLIDLKGIPELVGIRVDSGALVIGAATTHAQIATSPLVAGSFSLLAEVTERVGNARVRAQGSIGGNICFAEPRSDLTTVLVALDATVTMESPRGQREVRAADFLLGAYWTNREADELLTEIRVPLPEAPARGVYVKLQTSERPTVGVVALRRGDTVRIGIGAVAEKPFIADFDSASSVDSTDIASQLEPTADLAGSPRYKRHVTAVYIDRALAALSEVSR